MSGLAQCRAERWRDTFPPLPTFRVQQSQEQEIKCGNDPYSFHTATNSHTLDKHTLQSFFTSLKLNKLTQGL